MTQSMPVGMCQRVVEAAAHNCAAVAPTAPSAVPPPPNLDALAASLAAQSNAIASQSSYLTFGSVVLGAVALVIAVGWGYLLKGWAETAARDAVDTWMDRRGAPMIADLVAKLTPNHVDGGPRPSTAITQEQQENDLRDAP